jgi:hypothetical protein
VGEHAFATKVNIAEGARVQQARCSVSGIGFKSAVISLPRTVLSLFLRQISSEAFDTTMRGQIGMRPGKECQRPQEGQRAFRGGDNRGRLE